MNTVRMNKTELLNRMLKNREVHAGVYQKAMEVYRRKLVSRLEEMLRDVKQEGKVVTRIGLTKPISYLDEYDKVIEMLNVSVDDVIELSAHEFSKYVLDKWDWKESFNNLTEQYLGNIKRR